MSFTVCLYVILTSDIHMVPVCGTVCVSPVTQREVGWNTAKWVPNLWGPKLWGPDL